MIENMDTAELLQSLANDEFNLEGQFVHGSNYTFLGKIQSAAGEYRAVYKPAAGEMPLWDFPAKSLSKREVAAYIVSEALGWHLVPPTIFRRRKLPYGAGMVQAFIEHNPDHHFFAFSENEKSSLDVVAVFDEIINNADRKGSHVLIADDGRVYCIDHGVCFHIQDKLRTVIWNFAGQSIRADLITSLENYLRDAEKQRLALKPFLRQSEISALFRRIGLLIETPTHRIPGEERRMYPYPPV